MALAVVHEGVHLLRAVRDKGDDVELPVPVEVGDGRMDRPRQVEQLVALELAAAQVLHPAYLPLRVAELADHKVEPPGLGEAGRLHVGDTRHVVEQDVVREVVRPVVFQDHHGAYLLVVRGDDPHRGDEHVQVARAPQVRHLEVRGPGHRVAMSCSSKTPRRTWRIHQILFSFPFATRMSFRPSPSRSTTSRSEIHGRPSGACRSCGGCNS